MVESWKTPLFTLSDPVYVNGQLVQRASSVTLGMLVTALAILLVGGMISSALSRWLRSRLSKRLDLDPTTGAIVQKFTNYTLLFLVSLVALSAVQIPLTIFALLGGAAAIAIGFGAQQLANNLISGLILLFERPIRIGDFVEVGTFTGTVASIGTRCCQLYRDDGVEILIPNSVILQGTVVNHTLQGHASRLEISVAISLNAPVKQAMQILREAADAHPEIIAHRGIDAHVQDIGPSSIKLLLSFWSEAKTPLAIAKIQSDLRIAILWRFQAENIHMA
jgi:potassium efflux system protein